MRNSTGNCGKSDSFDAVDRAPHEQHGVSSKFEENKEFFVKLFCVFFSIGLVLRDRWCGWFRFLPFSSEVAWKLSCNLRAILI